MTKCICARTRACPKRGCAIIFDKCSHYKKNDFQKLTFSNTCVIQKKSFFLKNWVGFALKIVTFSFMNRSKDRVTQKRRAGIREAKIKRMTYCNYFSFSIFDNNILYTKSYVLHPYFEKHLNYFVVIFYAHIHECVSTHTHIE